MRREQCKTRIHILRRSYRLCKNKLNRSGSGRSQCKYFDKRNEILGDRPASSPLKVTLTRRRPQPLDLDSEDGRDDGDINDDCIESVGDNNAETGNNFDGNLEDQKDEAEDDGQHNDNERRHEKRPEDDEQRNEGRDGTERSAKKIVDGIGVSRLDNQSLSAFMDAEDEKLVGELDLQIASRILSSNRKEQKRWLFVVRYGPRIFKAARTFYRNFRRTPVQTSRSGKWVTRQYTNPSGTFRQAKKDFFRMRPTQVKPINGGYRGKLGKHNIIVRRKSRPTIEIQTGKPDMNLKRKFRYGPGN
ncbi:uncharacterized protein [Haliotis asinina]|uniref:uncharacterized protein n=1 Tax=Haliotis asinina TaxID=109174 RepID=UPI0035318140